MRIVVVGAGSSGCVVAARCARVPGVDVVLIEAGSSRRWAMPANRLPIGPGSTMIDPIGIRLDGRPDVLARGRGLGGSGAVNGGYFVRARAEDVADWPQSSWAQDAVTDSQRAIETDLDFPGDPNHGVTGPIPVQRVPVEHFAPATAAAADAFDRVGLPQHADLNDPTVGTGFGAVPGNIRDGLRIDSATAYFGDSAGQISIPTALRLRADVVATSIRIERGIARGVSVRSSAGEVEEIGADQVILCAGAVRSPQLLMLSGIGPADELSAAGIACRVDLPGVGRGLRDHPELILATDSPGSVRAQRPLEVIAHLEDVEIRPYTAGFGTFIPGVDDRRRYVGVALMRSATAGAVRLDPANPAATPWIDYDCRPDRPRLRAIRERCGPVGEVLGVLGVSAEDPGRLGMSLHASCSARMGTDDEAVVDDRCRVRGVDGLRVIDTSAFPSIPSRGPHATAMMFAERASTLLLDDLHITAGEHVIGHSLPSNRPGEENRTPVCDLGYSRDNGCRRNDQRRGRGPHG